MGLMCPELLMFRMTMRQDLLAACQAVDEVKARADGKPDVYQSPAMLIVLKP